MSEERIKAKVQMGILKPAHQVFEAVVDPGKMSRYFITTSTGRMESAKTLTWTWEDYDASHEVKVQNVEKDKVKVQNVEKDKFVLFTWEGSGVECLVVITIEPKGENQTLVKITESDWPADFEGATRCMGQVEGWTHFFAA